ncbi:hypothetical protein ACFV4K_04260 [Nocardia sp. NPDC059764]|uniref:hypothetical protein n=1 Tax=Nocardia sp. NPDC059764 TaxID=3346939 RepID=UPI00365871A1
MIAIGDELRDRYPQLLPVLTGLDGAADLVQADIGMRHRLLDAEICSRKADFTTIPRSDAPAPAYHRRPTM